MARKIFKYELKPKTFFSFSPNEVTVRMPAGAHVLSVGEQRGALMVWVSVDPEYPLRDYPFLVCCTGSDLPQHIEERHHIGTVNMEDKTVLHVFWGC